SFNLVLGISDLLCFYSHSASGAHPPTSMRVRLDQSPTATLSWVAPGGQDHYTILATRFDGSGTHNIELTGDRIDFSENTTGLTTCYQVVAKAGGAEIGRASTACAAPGIASLPSSVQVGGMPAAVEQLGSALPRSWVPPQR